MSSALGFLRWVGPRTLAFVVALLSLELGLHHFGNFGKWVVQEQSARYGWRMLPNQSGWSRDFDVREIINAQGFRDERDWGQPEHNDGHAVRLAVLGNSMTYGTSVPVERTWPRVLERRLRDELGHRGSSRELIVMNFATQGYTFEQMARLYEDEVAPWSPELLIVPVIAPDVRPMRPGHDDADYAFRRAVIRTATFDMLREHVMGRWIPDPRPAELPANPLRERELLLDAIRAPLTEAVAEQLGQQGAPEVVDRLYADVRRRPPGRTAERVLGVLYERLLDLSRLEGRSSVAVSDLWSAIESALPESIWLDFDRRVGNAPYHPRYDFLWDARMRRMSGIAVDLESRGGRLALVALPMLQRFERLGRKHTAPSPFQVWAGEWLPRARARGMEPLMIEPIQAFETRMGRLLDTLRVRDFIDPGPRQRIGEDYEGVEDSLFLLDDPGHYNAAGHELLAEMVFEALRGQGVIEEWAR